MVRRVPTCQHWIYVLQHSATSYSVLSSFFFLSPLRLHTLPSPITTVSLAANTYCMMDGHSSCTPHTVGPWVQFSNAWGQSHWWPASTYSRRPSVISGSSSCLILSISKPSVSQRSQIKEDTVEPSVPAREFNLKAYAAITWHNDPASLGLEPRLAKHRSQAAHTALPMAPPRQTSYSVESNRKW